ncbi:MAG: alkaline phosphatase family protein [Xanthobacteraceae bacterium]|nr:alkaline phosphatase family protein [Xanthobacteraceae bacterium]
MGGAVDPVAAVKTASPIKRVIILIGENRGLDHTFGTYTPKGAGQTISNLLSKGIVNADGTPGPNYALAQQYSVAGQPAWYFGAPNAAKSPYNPINLMPQPNTNGAPKAQGSSSAPFLSSLTSELATLEPDLPASQDVLLTTGATGLATGKLDTRVPGAGSLSGPFPLQGPNLTDDDYTGDMTHRFYQAAQQQDCSIANATATNPSGCLNDLFPFVMATYASNSSQGNEMGFYNSAQGQVSFLTTLADRFTLSDNFHQSFLGGTAANHMMFGTGDAVFWTDGNGNATAPKSSLLANPNPKTGTVNTYTVDGNFTGCGDSTQPGVAPILNYLASLPYHPASNCQAGHYYMIDNVNPGYLPNGALANSEGGIPPAPLRTIGDALTAKNISWAYFGGAYNDAVALSNAAVATNPSKPNLSTAAAADPAHALGTAYCQICNPFSYMTSIMGNPTQRAAHIKDTADLITGIETNTLPSVSIGKPDGLLDGHPSSSKIDLFEGYVQNVLTALQKNPRMLAETAVFITWDEAGGYYDSGYVQPVDFFGDGPRIPLLILSPYTAGGKVNHAYGDHVSLLKFIERNWSIAPITSRSRDNLPNPVPSAANLYVPANSPAIDDLFDAFDFTDPPSVPNYLP